MTIRELYDWANYEGVLDAEIKVMGADIKYIGHDKKTNSVVLDECLDEDMPDYMKKIR